MLLNLLHLNCICEKLIAVGTAISAGSIPRLRFWPPICCISEPKQAEVEVIVTISIELRDLCRVPSEGHFGCLKEPC